MMVDARDGQREVRELKNRTARSINVGDYLKVYDIDNRPMFCRVTSVIHGNVNRFNGARYSVVYLDNGIWSGHGWHYYSDDRLSVYRVTNR